MNQKDNVTKAVAVDSLLNFETVCDLKIYSHENIFVLIEYCVLFLLTVNMIFFFFFVNYDDISQVFEYYVLISL